MAKYGNLPTIKFTTLKCTIQYFLVFSQEGLQGLVGSSAQALSPPVQPLKLGTQGGQARTQARGNGVVQRDNSWGHGATPEGGQELVTT